MRRSRSSGQVVTQLVPFHARIGDEVIDALLRRLLDGFLEARDLRVPIRHVDMNELDADKDRGNQRQ